MQHRSWVILNEQYTVQIWSGVAKTSGRPSGYFRLSIVSLSTKFLGHDDDDAVVCVVGNSMSLFVLVSSGTDGHVDAGPVFKSETVWCLVSCQRLAVEAELQRVLAQALAFGKDCEDDAQSAAVTQAEVGFLPSRLVTEEDCDGVVPCGRLGWCLGGGTVARRSWLVHHLGATIAIHDGAFIVLGRDYQ